MVEKRNLFIPEDYIDYSMREIAGTVVGYSLAEQFKDKGGLEGKTICITGKTCSEPLIDAITFELAEKGAYGVSHYVGQNQAKWSSHIAHFKAGLDNAISFPDYLYEFFKHGDGLVHIEGNERVGVFKDFKRELRELRRKMDPSIKNIDLKPSVILVYPTHGEAEFNGMDYDDYKKLFLDSYKTDYRGMAENQKELKELFDSSDTLRVRTFDPSGNKVYELISSIKGQVGKSCVGLKNLPDGEVFTSPLANSVDGEIFLDIPIYSLGDWVSGIYLNFKNGNLVDFSAREGIKNLEANLNTDKGSKLVGEQAVGTNSGVVRTLSKIIFTEKIGGTYHMATGNSFPELYPDLGGLEKDSKEYKAKKKELVGKGILVDSATHLDIPKDFRNPREGEGIFFDDKEIKWDGERGIWQII